MPQRVHLVHEEVFSLCVLSQHHTQHDRFRPHSVEHRAMQNRVQQTTEDVNEGLRRLLLRRSREY